MVRSSGLGTTASVLGQQRGAFILGIPSAGYAVVNCSVLARTLVTIGCVYGLFFQALPLVVALALFEFLVVPVANFTHREFVTDIEAMSTHNNATIAYPPLNSTFENGLLIGPNGIPGDQIPDGRTVCAGTVVQAMTGYHVTSACQSILFQVGVGTL